MKRTWVAAATAMITLASVRARATDFYVAVDGNDTASGASAAPFATVERAQRAASPGDTVYIRGGVYAFSGTQDSIGVEFTVSGQPGKPIRYFAYQNEVPIFDLFQLRPQQRVTGLDVHASYIHLRGLEVRGVRQLIVGDSWSVRIRGDHNVIERLNVHDGEAPGIFITSGASNLILNCDSHHNYDPLEDGGNADGFGCHSSNGDNVLRGCRAYENSDDGFDFINAPGTCTVEESWAFRNGYIPGTNTSGANGAGFKSGGFGNPPNIPASGVPRHVVRRNVAFGNRVVGFYANYHPGGIDFFNNTAFDNPANFDMRPPTGGTTMHTLRNNIAAGSGRTIVNLSGGTDDSNSWSLPVQVTSADFVSMDHAIGLLPRGADGSLPDRLVRLVAGSDLIDKGANVGLPFTGGAPDLGAYEFGQAGVGPGDAGPDDAGSNPAGGTGGTTVPPGSGGSSGQGGQAGGTGGTGMPSGNGGMAAASPGIGGAAGASNASGARAASDGGDTGSSGCGCRTMASRSPGTAWLLGIAAAWFALCMRRRGTRLAR